MSIYLILESIINEATTKEIYDKYYSNIDYNTFIQIISADPRTNLQKNKMGAYSKILLRIYKDNNLRLEDLPKATEYLDVIYTRNIPVNINSINDLSDLYSLVKKYIAQDSGKLIDILPALNPNEYKILMNGNKWDIYTPKTEKAACYLGANTEWCTQWGKNSLNPKHRGRENQFNRYNNDTLYIIVNKKNESEKYQFHFASNQFMNTADKQIILANFLDNEDEIKRFFYPSLFNQELSPSENEINRIDYLNDGDTLSLMKKIIGDTTNELVISYINNNEEKLAELTNTEEPSLIDDGKIMFEFRRMYDNLSNLYNLYYAFKNEIQYDDYGDNLDNYEMDILNNRLFETYYEKNKDKLFKSYLIKNFDTFKSIYFDEFTKSDKIENKINEKYQNSYVQNKDASYEEAITEINKYFNFDRGYNNKSNEVYVKSAYFLKFLIEQNINKFDNANDLLDNYIDFYNIGTKTHDYNLEYWGEMPSYDDIEDEIENFFDDILENKNDNESECKQTRDELMKIIQNVFKMDVKIENDIAYVKIYPETLDCTKKTVKIDFRNKQTNEKFSGNVQLSNISNYVNNYQLFEAIINFKKLI